MFDLTRQEKSVILFLMLAALLGIGVNFAAKKSVKVKTFVCLQEKFTRIDLNKADKQSLLGVSGIGEKLAERIIAYREKTAGFKQVEELKQIKGLSGYRYEQIKDFFSVNE